MKILRLFSSFILLFAVLGCVSTPQPSFVRPASIPAGARITVYGVDFTRTIFADHHFTHEKLVSELLPNWNRDLAVAMRDELLDHPCRADLEVSGARNRTVSPAALLQVPGGGFTLPGPADMARALEPYTTGRPPGIGLVVFVDQISKDQGVYGYFVAFRVPSGEVLVAGTANAWGDGWGVYKYYLSPLMTLARGAAGSIAAAHPED